MAIQPSHTFCLTEPERRFLWLLAQREAHICMGHHNDGLVPVFEAEIRSVRDANLKLAASCVRELAGNGLDEIEELTRPTTQT